MKRKVIKKVVGFIGENSLFDPGEPVLVAVSGGADSVALLDILASLEEFRLELIVAHLNHLLRGEEADDDEEFVRNLAQRYDLPLFTKRVNVKELAARKKRSLEDAGRYARYHFFDELAVSQGANKVALAHHADDQAETLLLRLLRGSGGSGLCAMAPKSAGRYVRPLLCLSRDEIEGYLKDRGIPWRDDSSNASLDFLRNRIRHELIPILSGYNPAISERLATAAEALTADEAVLKTLTDSVFAHHVLVEDGMVKLSISGVATEQRGIRMRLYRKAITVSRGDLARISFRQLQAIDRLLLSQKPNASLTLPDGLRVSRCYGEIVFQSGEASAPILTDEILIGGPGIYPLPGQRALTVDYADPPERLRSKAALMEYFNPAEAPFPWRVRPYRPGDRISPLGMSGRKKVKDLFIDAKVPLQVRRCIPLLFSGETLLWVAGVRRSSAALVKPETGKVVRIELIAAP